MALDMHLPHLDKKVWLILLAGAVVIGLYLRSRSTSAATATPDTTGTDTTGSNDPYAGGAGSPYEPTFPYPVSPPPTAKKLKPKKHKGHLVYDPKTGKYHWVGIGVPTHVVKVPKVGYRRERGRGR
jgi:hypothetical protein